MYKITVIVVVIGSNLHFDFVLPLPGRNCDYASSLVHYTHYDFSNSTTTPVRFLPCDAMRCTVFVIVILSVRPSVCHTRGLCPHGSTYDHDFFTIW